MVRKYNFTYEITQQTKAIISSNSAYYRSKILDVRKDRYGIETPNQIIAHNCEIHKSTLAGRRKVVQSILQTNSKIPIPVNPNEGIYLMPTASIRNHDCVWLSYYQIQFYEQRDNRMYVAFYDGSGLYLRTSKVIFDMQFKKTSQVIAAFHRSSIFPNT